MRIIKILLTVIFLGESFTKLIGFSFQINFFQHWGYPMWFMYLIGILELAGIIGLWLPRLSRAANIGLICLMIGIFYTHISRNDPAQNMGLAIMTSILLLVNLYFSFENRNKLLTN